jgi:hypothetical protein
MWCKVKEKGTDKAFSLKQNPLILSKNLEFERLIKNGVTIVFRKFPIKFAQ